MNSNELTPKQEAFCIAVASGKSLSQAYRECYNAKGKMETLNRNAFELYHNTKITTRIEELREEKVKELKYTARESFENLQLIQELALSKSRKLQNGEEVQEPDLTSAIRAEELKGKLAQLYIEKKEVSLSGDLKERADELRKELFGTNKE